MINLIRLLLNIKVNFTKDKVVIIYKALRVEVSDTEVKLNSVYDLGLNAEHHLLLNCTEADKHNADINYNQCSLPEIEPAKEREVFKNV